MRIRHLFLFILAMFLIAPTEAQVSGSSIASEEMVYDAHGNITGITRRGKVSSGGYGIMDNLTLSYDGNRLAGVSETVADYDFAGSFEYRRANGSQYMYDANGSLVADKSRGIAYITYDANGNPNRIYFTNGSQTRYTYSAAGEKLLVEHYVAAPNVTVPFGAEPDALTQGQVMYDGSTQYLLGGSLVVKDGLIDRYLFDGGYAKAIFITPTTYSFEFYYYNRDHLGNIREVVDSAGVVRQVTNYYPFGTPYTDPAAVMNANMQPYKYNGKELDRMHGLDTYDYGARQYDPVLGRWDRMDPLCEKYYDISPYAYCANPILYRDKDGKEGIRYTNDNGEKVIEENIVVLLEKELEIPSMASEKRIKKIQRKNEKIRERNNNRIEMVNDFLNEVFSDAYNSNGEHVIFKFNLIRYNTNNPNLSSKDLKEIYKIGFENGLSAVTTNRLSISYGYGKAFAAVYSQCGSGADLGITNNRILVRTNDMSAMTFSHEIGHTLNLDDYYPNFKNGLMNYPPSYLTPQEVDNIWNNAYDVFYN